MKPWMWKTLEVLLAAFMVCDALLLAACWFLMQAIIAVTAWGIWRTTSGWHGVAGTITFAAFTTLVWGLVSWVEARHHYAAFREWRAARRRSYKREIVFF